MIEDYNIDRGYLIDDSSLFRSRQHLEEVAERIARTVSEKILENMK